MKRVQVVLAAYPDKDIDAKTFSMVEAPLPELANGEALVENIYATVDPAQSRRLRRYANYVPPLQHGELIAGLALGHIIASRCPQLKEGDYWSHWSGWETHSVIRAPASEGPLMQKVRARSPVLTDYLGPLGGKGITAWVAIRLLGDVRTGDRVLVSAAAGAVGGIAGQLARAGGAAQVAGIAGGERKMRYLRDVLGYDAVIDRRKGEPAGELDRIMPDGIDLYLDNVGGGLQESVMERMRQFGRFVITGTVSEYGMDVPPPGPNLFATVRRGFSIHGFIATQYYDRFEEFHEEMQSHLADGRVKAPVDVVEGLDQAAAAMAGMLAGDNVGQRLIRIAPDPTL